MPSVDAPGLVIPVRRRRSSSSDPLRKVTLQLSTSVVAAIKSAVETGEAASTNVFVEEAVRERLRECRRARIYAAYEEAARDSKYLQAIDADMVAFDVALADGSGR